MGQSPYYKFTSLSSISIISVLLGITSQISLTSGSHGGGGSKHGKKESISPDVMFAAVEEAVHVAELAEHGKKCNMTLYNSSPFKLAWGMADDHKFAAAAELFNSYVKITRKGQNKKWRQDRCDALPYSLMECRRPPPYNETAVWPPPTCHCLTTRLTDFVLEKKHIDGQFVNVCRVKYGLRCSYESSALRCAHNFKCVSGFCSASTMSFHILTVLGFSVIIRVLLNKIDN